MLVDRLSIQSKLMLALLSVSIGSILVMSGLGYADGRAVITNAVHNQLAGMRETRSNELKAVLDGLKNQALILASAEGTIGATKAFKAAFHDLDRQAIPKPWQDQLAQFYADEFLPGLVKNLHCDPSLELYLPRSVPARYLQYQYIASSPQPYDHKAAFDGPAAARDEYAAIHRRYHPRFRDVFAKSKYEDVLLIDPDTLDVVYSVKKMTEFATSLRDGPYARTKLAEMVASVARSKDRGAYQFSDFEFWYPDLGMPNAFLACPIFDGPTLVGILAIEFPIEEIDRVMTGGGNWEKEGLGQTGEVYLVGADTLMRSRARSFLHDKAEVLAALRRTGVPESTMDRIDAMGTLVLNLPVQTESVKLALEGKTGTAPVMNYRAVRVLSAHAPFSFEGVRWAILAEMQLDEAYAPIRTFGRKVLSYSAGIIVAVTILAALLAAVIVRPLRRLAAGAKRVGLGDVDVVVDVKGHDEFRELADAFNEMTRGLKAKNEEIGRRVRENEELLLNILPGPILARRKGSDDRVPEGFADISVLFAEITGFTELSGSVEPGKAVDLLNELVGAIDEAAERLGVEKVKTSGPSYLAACGLSIHRPDHANRMVDFALEVLRIVRRFNQGHGTSLAAVVGVNAGPVVGGIVGRSKFIYDLWGDTVNIAQAIRLAAPPNSVAVSQAVKDRLRDAFEFEGPVGVDARPRGPLATWVVKSEA